MNTSTNSDLAKEQNKPPAKKPAFGGLFAGMSVKKKPNAPAPSSQPMPQNRRDSSPHQESSDFSINKSNNPEPEKPTSTQHGTSLEADADEILEFSQKKPTRLPFFKASKTVLPQLEPADEPDLFQFSGRKSVAVSDPTLPSQADHQESRTKTDDILDFDIANVDFQPPQKDEGGKQTQEALEVIERENRDKEEPQSIEFISSEKKVLPNIETTQRLEQRSKNKPAQASKPIEPPIQHENELQTIDVVSKKSVQNDSKNTQTIKQASQELTVSAPQPEVAKPAKKVFGFIKKANENTALRPEQPNTRAQSKADKLFAEDAPVPPPVDPSPHDLSLNDNSNTLDKLNKDLSQISDKEGFRDELDQSRNSRDSLLSQTKTAGRLAFSEKIARDFKLGQLEARVLNRFERFISEAVTFIKRENNLRRDEVLTGEKRKNLSAQLSQLEQQLQARLVEEDYLAAESVQDQINALSEQLAALGDPGLSNSPDTDEQKKTLQDVALFDRLKGSFSSELNKLMGDKIFIKEKRIFFEESSREVLQRRREELAEAESKAQEEVERVRRAKAATERVLKDKEALMLKETGGLQTKIGELEVRARGIETEIEELQKALVRKQNELFGVTREIETARQGVAVIEARFRPQLSQLDDQRTQETEAELAADLRLSNLATQQTQLQQDLCTLEAELLKTDALIVSLDDLRERFKTSLEQFEELFGRLFASGVQRGLAKEQWASARREHDLAAAQLDQLQAEASQLAKDAETIQKELDRVQAEIPALDAQKKLAVKEKNFALANFHSKEFKRLEQLEVSLKAELTQLLVRQEELARALPGKQARLVECRRQCAPEQLANVRAIAESARLSAQILQKAIQMNPAIAPALAPELDFCNATLADFARQEKDLEALLQQNPSTTPVGEPDALNTSFTAKQNTTDLAEPVLADLGSSAPLDPELDRVIKQDHEDEAWQNFIGLFRATRQQSRLETQLTAAVAEEDYETAAALQEQLDALEKQRKEFSLAAQATEIYLVGSEAELKQQYTSYLDQRLAAIEHPNGELSETQLGDLRLRLETYRRQVDELALQPSSPN